MEDVVTECRAPDDWVPPPAHPVSHNEQAIAPIESMTSTCTLRYAMATSCSRIDPPRHPACTNVTRADRSSSGAGKRPTFGQCRPASDASPTSCTATYVTRTCAPRAIGGSRNPAAIPSATTAPADPSYLATVHMLRAVTTGLTTRAERQFCLGLGVLVVVLDLGHREGGARHDFEQL